MTKGDTVPLAPHSRKVGWDLGRDLEKATKRWQKGGKRPKSLPSTSRQKAKKKGANPAAQVLVNLKKYQTSLHKCKYYRITITVIAPLEVKFTSLSDLPSGGPFAPTRHLCSPSHAGGYYIGPLDKAGQAQWGDVGRCGESTEAFLVTWVQDHRHSIVFLQLPGEGL